MPTTSRNTGLELAVGKRVYLASPAGYGKTHSIAEAVKEAAKSQGRQLVLTHTHAGVHALQSKLRALGVPAGAYNVETIAGWALKYAASYRKVSGLVEQPIGGGWDVVYPAAIACLAVSAIRDIIVNTYGGMFVDEYQDCIWTQHELVMALAEILPCRLLGDPLQAIFDFAGRTVDLDHDLDSFERLDPLTVPYRWLNDGNQPLADWLHRARQDIEAGNPLTISGPVSRIDSDSQSLQSYCRSLLGRNEGVVVAHRFGPQSHVFARGSGARYKSMEEMDCGDLMGFARKLDASDPSGQAVALLDYVATITSNVSQPASTLKAAVERGGFKPSRYGANRQLAESIGGIISGKGPAELANALDAIGALNGARTYRRELNRETFRMFKAMEDGKCESYEAAALEIRERTRRLGRPAEKLTSSRILLIKGLQYDHAVVANADTLGPRELYVAISRGSKSLAIQSSSRTVTPRGAAGR